MVRISIAADKKTFLILTFFFSVSRERPTLDL
jgi:hypothetical protein